MTDNNIEKSKQELIVEIDKRIDDKIIEKTNADLLKKLINNAETLTEAIAIAELGTTYKRTGFHFDKRLEKINNTIKYLKKNEGLSFKTDENATTHKLIIGDNYDALLNLLIEYKGKIDIIYIDPPYGKDSMGEFAQTNYDNTLTRDNLLSMLYPRLVLAKQLLTDNGVIFCSIDDKNQAYLKGLFDDVFGENNFIDILHWKKKKQPSFLRTHTAKVMEYILVYGKIKSSVNKLSIEKISDATKKVVNLTNAISLRHFGKGVRVKIGDSGKIEKGKYTIKSMQIEYLQDVIYEDGITINEVDVKAQFSVSQEKINEYIKDNLLFITINKGLRRDVSEEEKQREKAITDLLLDWGDNQDSEKEQQQIFGGIVFEYIKPVKLIQNLIKSSSDEDSIILDFFAGSGTTGQAVLELNKEDGGSRQFILATSNEITDTTPNGIVQDVTSKRLKRIMTGKCYDGTSNFKWLENNKPFGDNLDVYEINTVANFEATKDKTPFDVIDETLYGKEKLSVNDKIKWVCENFDGTQSFVENDNEYESRIRGEE